VCRIDDPLSGIEQQVERRAAARPIDAELHRGARRDAHRSEPAAAEPGRQASHRSHQRLTHRYRVGLRE